MTDIDRIIRESLRKKFERYSPETKHMPFHHRLLGKDRMALYSFFQSLNTTFGTSIFESAAEAIAKSDFALVKKQYVIEEKISKQAQSVIQEIIDIWSSGTSPQKNEEIERIISVCTKGDIVTSKPVKVGLAVQDYNGMFHLFDLKQPNPIKAILRILSELFWSGRHVSTRKSRCECSVLSCHSI